MTTLQARLASPLNLRKALVAGLSVLSLLAAERPGAAVDCNRSGCGVLLAPECGATPARPVPQSLWGELEPVDPSPLPSIRDASNFNEFFVSYDDRNWYVSMSTQGGYLFAGLSTGFAIWDARSNPADPTLLGRINKNNFLTWSRTQEAKWPLLDTDAVDENAVASVGVGNIGIAIFNATNKAQPNLVYQNDNKDGYQVYTANINGTKYAFMASQGGEAGGGLYAYNMSAALQLASPCLESVPLPGEPVRCPGVYLGRVGSRTSVGFVHGVDRFVVLSSGATPGFELYDYSNPASPQLRLTGLGDRPVFGVAMWKQGSAYYLATRSEPFNGISVSHLISIYDVSCIAGSGPCSLGAPLSVGEYDTGQPNSFFTFSRNGSTPFLYLGSENRCGVPSLQREYLFDVSNPAAPRDITPAPAIYNGLLTGYWGWYYKANPTGFNNIMAREGVFIGDYFYRAALSIFDIHKRTGGSAPTAAFDWSPAEIYPGTPVTFTDRSTGGVNQRSWTFLPDGSPSASSASSPLVTFPAKGAKVVTLNVSNAVGPGQLIQNVTVLDPVPQIAGITVSPASPVVCQPVTFTGTGVTGAPPLTYNWQVTKGAVPVTSSTQASFTWDTSTLPNPAGAAGSYQVALTVGNASPPPANRSATFTLTAPAALPAAGGFTPSFDPFSNAVVHFHVNVPGATSWNWDFGSGYTGWTSDPAAGPNPTFTYTSIGSKTVRVKVRNCVEAERESAPLTVTITQITPLVAAFQATGGVSCLGSTCLGTSGIAITFADLSTGPPDTWQYDWDGDGTFEQSSPTAVTTHTYTTEGTFRPALRVKRGAETSTPANSQQIVVGGVGPVLNPAISLDGPTTGTVGQAYTFTATAANCTPSSSWSWNTAGGAVTGSSAGSAITLTWDSAGTRSVSVTNSGCAGAVGTRGITISTPGGNPNDPLAANFTFSPGSPRTTDAVNFDASSSTGTPVTYAWDFGDSTTGSGKTASHTYPNPGTYLVVLTVTKPGQGANCFFGTCASSITKAVVVSGGPPPVTADFSVTGAQCVSQFGFNQCTAGTGQSLAFAASDASGTTFTWTFGDGSTATGRNVNHSFSQAGTFTVQLSVSNGQTIATLTRTFVISGAPVQQGASALLLPWIAQANAGGLLQSTDFYAYNPGSEAMTLHIKFLVRGTPDPSAPTVNKTIAAGATLYQQNALQTLFNQPNTSGFLYFTWDGGAGKRPVVASINRTFVGSNSFGQSVPAIPIARLEDGGATATPVQYLVGLNDTNERLSSFGVSNPYPAVATVRFRFFDKLGRQIGSPVDKTLSGFGQKQFQPAEIRGFGVRGDDYRVQVETLSGGPVYAFGTTVRLATGDPSFIPAGDPGQQTVYLVGALSQPSGGGLFRSDAVLYNPTNQVVITEMTYRNVGVTSTPTDSVTLSLQPGETRRLADAVFSNWRLTNAVGILSFTSNSPTANQYLIAYGETYDDTHPQARYGQSMAALSSKDLAKVGQTQVLTGLIDNATTRTVLWLFNPTAESATVDLTYRALDGRVLGTRTGYVVPPGIVRQISNGTNPIPANFPEAFTVEVAVKAGSVLSSAQVIINSNSDPTYIPGQTF